MFEKLTTRERNLAYAVLGLVPAVLLFIGIFWFIGKFNENKLSVDSLSNLVMEEELMMATAKKANRRRAYFDSISFPAGIEDASDYQSWMKGLVRDELQMELKSLTPNDASDLKFDSKTIGRRKYFMLRADGNLDQLTRFLTRFYSVDLLHRINSLKVIAQNETAGSKKKIRTGMLAITAKIEVLALDSAVDSSGFMEKFEAERASKSRFAETNEAYREMVVHRDIFGPPNNSPTVSASPRSSYTSETDASFSITAKDADDDDQLTFEILDSSVEGAELEPPKAGSRSVRMKVPGQKAGRYAFKVKVSDDGFPAKEAFKEFSVTFEDEEIVHDEPEPEPAPFINAKETKITGIAREKSGDWRVFIKVLTTGEPFHLKVGESFELDEMEWVVQDIKPRQAVFRVDNKLLTFEPADRFVNPRSEVTLEVPGDDGAKELPKKGAKSEVEIESDAAPKPRPAGISVAKTQS